MSTLTAYELARMAGCADPDSPDSPGAKFLYHVRDAVDEIDAEDLWNAEDRVHEIADDAPDVYTYQRWLEFVDLAAWTEDPSEIGSESTNMTDMAGYCLYLIGSRLAQALITERRENEPEV